MVGVPRSTGCHLCVKRRVRCDEARPACGNCVRYGAECPGYARALKFVAGKHEVRREPAKKAALPPISTPSPPADLSPGSRTTLLPFVEDLLSQRNEVDMFHFSPWFRGLPDRVGRKVTLDSAVFAFTLHLRGTESGDVALVARARGSYVQSLSALQAALNHPTEWRSSETLCSAMLLCLYEVRTSFSTSPFELRWFDDGTDTGSHLRGQRARKAGWDTRVASGGSCKSAVPRHTTQSGMLPWSPASAV
ncbi:Zn(II)2Cys6 transcription factor [Candidatus Bathyarchaeota archaeon]|nr:Zn(II)2Cys6 transcription factor [Candidatus Bathyarchaeota archaeon]